MPKFRLLQLKYEEESNGVLHRGSCRAMANYEL
jgi:hypothetical protein